MHHGAMCDLAPAGAVLGCAVCALAGSAGASSQAGTRGCSRDLMKFRRENHLFPKPGGTATG